MVHLACTPEDPATYRSCSGYLTAALSTKHTMMIAYNGNNKKWSALKVSKAKLKVNSNADDFIDVHGDEWFFCKCKTERVKECEAM